jgi:cytochrome P450
VTALTSPEADALLLELLLSDEGRRDPYPRYRRLLAEAPVLRTGLGPLVVSRYEDVQQALRDPKMGRAEGGAGFGFGGEEEVSGVRQRMAEDQTKTMLMANPPQHTRLRRLVSREFTPHRVEALKPAILRMVDAICDRMADEGRVDVMDVLAFPLPVTVIGELLGVPEADRPGFQPLVQDLIVTLELNATDEQLERAEAASIQVGEYFGALIEERRAHPADDLLTALARAPKDDGLTEEEIVATAILLFAAGFETTTNLIGNGVHALLSNPDQLQRLRDEPDLTHTAVEEVLRYDSPVQLNGRSCLEATTIAGVPIDEGDFVICLQGAANHDPGHWTQPERFDVGRHEGPPLSFGSGIHHCLGAGLARAEGDVVFRRVLERFSTITPLDPDPPRKTGLTLRGIATLPVEVVPA